jgi:tetratricopeptide (TPR) repeat protein
MTTAAPPTAEDFVARLLAIDSVDRQRAMIARTPSGPSLVHEGVLAMVAEAERVMGADPRRMERLCLDALTLAETADDDYLRAMATMRHGDYLRVAGQNTDAYDRYDHAAAIFTRIGRPVEAARTRIGWTWVAAELGLFERPLAVTRKARAVLVANGEIFRAAALEASISQIYWRHGRYRPALQVMSRALDMYRSLGEAGQIAVARCHANLGITLTRLGRYLEAMREFDMARGAFRELGDIVGTARVTRNMGEALMEIGRYAAALRRLEDARAGFRQLELSGEAAQVGPVLAECYLYLNRPADALASLAEADDDLSRTDAHPVAQAVAIRRVAAHLLLGDSDQALMVLDEADRQFQTGATQHRAWLAEQRATLILRDGDPNEALEIARNAERLARTTGARRRLAAATLVEGAVLVALGKHDDALRVADRARRHARAVDAAPLLARTHELIGRVAETRGRPAIARRSYAKAIEQLEREQRGVIFEFRDSFAAERGAAYERLALLQLRAGRPIEAFHTAERAKSRALADAIAGAVEPRPRGSHEARRLARELDRVRGEYAAAAAAFRRQPDSDEEQEQAARHLAEFEQRVSLLVRRMQLAAPEDESALLYGDMTGTELPQVPANTALIEYFISGDDILRFRIDQNGVQGDLLPGVVPEVERLLRTFRLNLDMTARTQPGGPEQPGLTEQARRILTRLEERLLGGLGDLTHYAALVIVPHGFLHYLPFHAFHDGTRYLVERVAVSYVPSAAIYAVCRRRAQRRGRRRGAIVLAHSAGGRLPSTLQEGAAVGAVLGAPVHTEEEATRSLLEKSGKSAGLIHIAAHGSFRPDAPLFSSIELADGPLTTADIFGLNLRAGLVTLSACETGRAVVGGGDELAGLARAFLYAGAAGLLVSQWRVDDASTAALMSGFYRALAAGNDRAGTLRTAQCGFLDGSMLENGHAHPFYWAGFQFIGDR